MYLLDNINFKIAIESNPWFLSGVIQLDRLQVIQTPRTESSKIVVYKTRK
jgi:hypothetical protein